MINLVSVWLQEESRGDRYSHEPLCLAPCCKVCRGHGSALYFQARCWVLRPGCQPWGSLAGAVCACTQHPTRILSSFLVPSPTWLAHMQGRQGARGSGWFSWLLSGQSPGSSSAPNPRSRRRFTETSSWLLSEPGPEKLPLSLCLALASFRSIPPCPGLTPLCGTMSPSRFI